MGEEEKYTAEELKILGEEPPTPAPGDQGTPAPEPEKKEPEPEVKLEPEKKEEEPPPEEKQAMESMGLRIDKGYIIDDDGTKIPAKRWKSLYRDFQEEKRGKAETERKLTLFKELGPEKYYEIHPGEAPAGWKPPEKEEKPLETAIPSLGAMIVKGGPHDGKTLNEVWQEDPAYASAIQNNYLDTERRKVETEHQTNERLKRESEEEINTFTVEISKELFDKEADKLTPKEEAEIAKAIQSVLDWMGKTNRGSGKIQDAYFLMNKEKILTDAKTKGAKAALEGLKKPSIPSISPAGGAVSSGFSAYEGMTAEQLADEVAKMSDKEAMKFFREAPQSLRAKFPSAAWT